MTLNLWPSYTFLQCVDLPYQAIRQTLSARKTFFHDFTPKTLYLFFQSWSHWVAFMVEQLEIEPADTG
jgi:hypothetical protein